MARVCNRHKVAYSPGCGSASAISQAEELGEEERQEALGISVDAGWQSAVE